MIVTDVFKQLSRSQAYYACGQGSNRQIARLTVDRSLSTLVSIVSTVLWQFQKIKHHFEQ